MVLTPKLLPRASTSFLVNGMSSKGLFVVVFPPFVIIGHYGTGFFVSCFVRSLYNSHVTFVCGKIKRKVSFILQLLPVGEPKSLVGKFDVI